MQGITLAGATNLALLAPVREGLAPGFEPVSYLERLRRLLDAMHASRRNVREAELREPFFPDPIGRFGIITGFRYALVPPAIVASSRWHLSLNVTFDGGWEPYLRVIYRDIGALLDALLCHCDGYVDSLTADFDDYCRWVRAAELNAGIFYTDSPATLADQRYLARVERIQRECADPAVADARIAAHAEPDAATALARGIAQALAAPTAHLPLPLRTLKGLYRLTGYWSGADGKILRRFAQLVLGGLRHLLAHQDFPPVLAEKVGALFQDELAWLGSPADRTDPAERLAWNEALLQGPLHGDAPPATHGALVLLRVADPKAAVAHLAGLAPRCAAPATREGEARLQVMFTPQGLHALQVHPDRLARLPAEFRDGMERRAGILGDVRANHPDHWRRPLRHSTDPAREDRIDLSTVDVAVMLRTSDPDNRDATLHPLLAAAVAALGAAGSGLRVLAVEPTRSRTVGPNGREHFGFADGISQPRVVTGGRPVARHNEVRPGELALGFTNDRGDTPRPAQTDPLLDHGSFVVVRKLRQRVDRLQPALERAVGLSRADQDELLERMVGRRKTGDPLVAAGRGGNNDFDYSGPDGPQCPFASHVRRTNPRGYAPDGRTPEGQAPIPRILRRGMSYGPATDEGSPADERGTLFMACCASIAEQFETLQRWVAGGNSSGVGSAQADPLMGVPRTGEARVFRWIGADGTPRRADLGDQAFVELQWGLYLFSPSLAALAALADFRFAPPPPPTPPDPQPLGALDAWRAKLEDRDAGRATWAEVRAAPGHVMDAAPYGWLVGSANGVFAALADTQTLSVRGFGERMQASLGLNHLGMDPADGHGSVGGIVNREIARVDEAQAFAAAHAAAVAVLAGTVRAAKGLAPDHPDGRACVPVDLVAFSENVVGALAKAWFGLPDGQHLVVGGRVPTPDRQEAPPPLPPPRCPGHLIGPSRMIFGAQPREAVRSEGELRGVRVKAAVHAAVTNPAGPLSAPITERLREPLAALADSHGADLLERELTGLLLGFAPTVHGNFLTVMRKWIEGDRLWSFQQDLAERLAAGDTPLEAARAALRRPMLDTMQDEPVPPMVWRRPVVDGTPDATALPVVLGLASAIASPEVAGDEARRDALLFGGDYFAPPDSGRWGLHACPGAKMGLGVMLAMALALLGAGTLRPTGSPVLLMLTPTVPPPA